MSEGRTVWFAKDCSWWRREGIVALGLEFGASGPAVIDWLYGEAKLQNDGGKVKSGQNAVAQGAFVDLVTVCHVLSRAVELGVLDDFEADKTRFTCRISGYRADQDRAKASFRQAAKRERDRAESSATAGDSISDHVRTASEDAVTDRDESRLVTPRHAESPTEQDSINSTPLTPQGGSPLQESSDQAPAPRRPGGARQRDLAAYRDQVDAWSRTHFPDGRPEAVADLISWAREGLGLNAHAPLTADMLREFAIAAGPIWSSHLGIHTEDAAA